jgi:SAM-dependent methyltransferase
VSQNPEDRDWVAERGDKWRAHLSHMEPTLKPVDEPLIQALRLDAPLRIAEVGCGGGATTLEILRRAPAGSTVSGFDISPSLVEAARAAARGRTPPGGSTIAFEVADMATAAPDRPYQRLASRFGIMFFADPPAAFANLARWLAPGGRFAFAAWGSPSENPWMTSVREVVARTIALPPADPEAPGPFRYADAGKLLALLERAGLNDLAVHDWRGALPIGGGLSPVEAARFALASFSSFGELLAQAGPAAFDEALRSLTALYSQRQRDGAIAMDAGVHLFTGARP